MKTTAILNIQPAHVEIISDTKREREVKELMNKICINPECKKYYRHSNNVFLRFIGSLKEFIGA